MSVNAASPYKEHSFTGPGSYSVPFKVLATADIECSIIALDGSTSNLVNGIDFSVTLYPGNDYNGAVIIITATTYVASGTLYTRNRMARTQEVDWVNGGPLDMPLLTRSFDKLTMLIQQMGLDYTELSLHATWRGQWVTGTAYVLADVVEYNNSFYQARSDHVASAFATDLASGIWFLAVDYNYILAQLEDAALTIANIGSRKNYAIDGDFTSWLMAVTQTANGYGSDTLGYNANSGTTKTHSREALAVGSTTVPGGIKHCSRTVVVSVPGVANHCYKEFRLEALRALAGQNVTISFHGKADSPKNIAIELVQNFGTGGAPSTAISSIGSQLLALTGAFTKKAVTIAVPTIDAKVLGTDDNSYLGLRIWFDAGSNYAARAASLGQQSGTFDIARLRVVAGTTDGDAIDLDVSLETERVSRYFRVDQVYIQGTAAAAGSYFSENVSIPAQMRAAPAAAIVSSVPVNAASVTLAYSSSGGVQARITSTAAGLASVAMTLSMDARL